jgi:hypothetical protein
VNEIVQFYKFCRSVVQLEPVHSRSHPQQLFSYDIYVNITLHLLFNVANGNFPKQFFAKNFCSSPPHDQHGHSSQSQGVSAYHETPCSITSSNFLSKYSEVGPRTFQSELQDAQTLGQTQRLPLTPAPYSMKTPPVKANT